MSDTRISRPSDEKSTFIIEPLLPTREIHLIAGGSGSGKSTLACQITNALMNCGEFFGMPIPKPHKVAYLAFDRSEKGMRRTFERTLGSKEIPFPFYSTITSQQFRTMRLSSPFEIIAHLMKLHPEVDVLIIDGIGMAFKGDSSSLYEISKFIHDLIRMLHESPADLTIFALHHMGKTKKGNEYAQPRQRLHGSVGWAATCETCILIEPENEADPENPYRKIIVCPRQMAERVYTYAFDEDGRLVLSAALIKPTDKQAQFIAEVAALAEGEVEYDTLKEIADKLETSEATFHRWLSRLSREKAILSKIRVGVYKRLKTQ